MPLGGDGQTLSHEPQFCVSAEVLRQSLPHGVKPVSHSKPHTPPVHLAKPFVGSLHAVPHAWQLAGSELVSTHWPLQATLPAEHELEQVPESHT